MARGRNPARIFLGISVLTLVVSVVGFVVTLVLNTFFLDKFDAYGEVPVPGTRTLHLPAGEVTVTFHTLITGSGGGLPIPELSMNIVPPDGVSEPKVTEDVGVSTTVNNDARRRVWVAQIPVEGDYRIETQGNVSAFINPHLAFGQSGSAGSLPWVFGALFAVGLVDLVIAILWLSRSRRATPRATPQPFGLTFSDAQPYTPTGESIRVQQLKTIAALRESGALTEAEFQAEKRRILESE